MPIKAARMDKKKKENNNNNNNNNKRRREPSTDDIGNDYARERMTWDTHTHTNKKKRGWMVEAKIKISQTLSLLLTFLSGSSH
jgi:hypothetical protein